MKHPYPLLDPSSPQASLAGKCALAIMAKAPIPGKVKTRLSPPLSPQQSADLNACFLRDTIANLSLAIRGVEAAVVISYTPSGHEAAFLGIVPEDTLLLLQRGDTFGERLLLTAEDLFACGFSSVCLIDSDSPTVPTIEFRTAVQELARAGSRAVLGPSADGGYYLIGIQTAEPVLFERITWSTGKVAAETLARADEVQLPVTLLAEWYDVDDAASLKRLRDELAGDKQSTTGSYHAPHTRQYLRRLDQLNTTSPLVEKFA